MFGPGESNRRTIRFLASDSNIVDLVKSLKDEGLINKNAAEGALEETVDDAETLRVKFSSWVRTDAPEWSDVKFGVYLLLIKRISRRDWLIHWYSYDANAPKWPKVVIGRDEVEMPTRYDGIQKLFVVGDPIISKSLVKRKC